MVAYALERASALETIKIAVIMEWSPHRPHGCQLLTRRTLPSRLEPKPRRRRLVSSAWATLSTGDLVGLVVLDSTLTPAAVMIGGIWIGRVSTAFAKRCLLRAARCHARIREISSSKGNSCDYRPAQKSPPGHRCGCSAIHNRSGRLRPHPNPIVIVLTGRQRQPWADFLGDTGEAHRLHSPVL